MKDIELLDILIKALNGLASGDIEWKTISEIKEEIGFPITNCCCEESGL